jgi:TonB-dependent receptor
VHERETIGVVSGSADTVLPRNQQVGQTGTVSAQWGGMLNLAGRLGNGTKVSLNNTFNRSADNTAGRWLQNNEEFGHVFEVTRLSFVQRQVRSHQLHGEHLLGYTNLWEWYGSVASVSRDEPDRSDLVYETEEQNGERMAVRWWDGSARPATRTFSTIDESAYETGTSLRLAFGAPGREFAIKFGGSYRRVEREADSRAFDIVNLGLSEDERAQPAEQIFAGAFAEQGRLFLLINANGGVYTATDRNLAGFLQFEVPLGRRIRVIGGARLEKSDLEVQSLTAQGAAVTALLDDLDVLPALTVNVALSANSNLRLSGTQTLARPEYRELSPTTAFPPIGGPTMVGNPELRRSLIQNADLRWEYFPTPGEVFSVSLFAKNFDDPIERVFIATTGAPRVSWVNAEGAVNYGVELEARKNLSFLGEGMLPFAIFTNVTLMESDIEPGPGTALSDSSRPLVGQAEYVVNGGVSYNSVGGALSITGLYNLVGPRVHEAAVLPIAFNSIEQERHVVDLSLRWQATPQVGIKLDAKNLLNEAYRIEQGSVVRHEYWTGRGFALGLTWRPWY